MENLLRTLIRALRLRADAEAYGIQEFIRSAGSLARETDVVLDAGAGDCPYKIYFMHTIYESCDITQNSAGTHTFLCDVQSIPRPDNTYNVVISTQVLDDVPYPQRVIDECFRILKPGGSLFLTAPQGWGIHNAPYHFFGFTCYGLKLLFDNAGFETLFIKPRGGIFWYLGRRIRGLPTYLYKQDVAGPDGESSAREQFKAGLNASLLKPLYFLAYPVCRYVIPLICFYLDRIDRRQDYTLGYACHCVKQIPPHGTVETDR